MTENHRYLFAELDFGSVLRRQEELMVTEVDSIEKNQLLNSNESDLATYFEQKYMIRAPIIDESSITLDQAETTIDVSGDPNRYFSEPGRPFYVTGTAITYCLPFDGDANLFRCRPSTYSLNPPRGFVDISELRLVYSRTDHNADAVKNDFNRDMAQIRGQLEVIGKEATAFNQSLRGKALQRITARRQKLLNDQGMAANLGFPLKKRANTIQTYVAPIERRRVEFKMPKASTAPFSPEPTLEMSEYEHVLTIISNMVKVMERSPKAFIGMKEEDLRNHFLVQLNGYYEGQATGETFNSQGKTDILIRVQGNNIFIAECKFWEGPEAIKKALDQLLGYVAWRDTKVALIIFNRNKDFSGVLKKIDESIKSHPNYKRPLSGGTDTSLRAVFANKDDPNKEFILTAMAFEVPT